MLDKGFKKAIKDSLMGARKSCVAHRVNELLFENKLKELGKVKKPKCYGNDKLTDDQKKATDIYDRYVNKSLDLNTKYLQSREDRENMQEVVKIIENNDL